MTPYMYWMNNRNRRKGVAIVEKNCFETQLRRGYKEPPGRGLWLILGVCIRPSISVQATRPLPISRNWTRSSCLLRYKEILTFSFSSFHCCSLETNSSALLLGKSKSLIRSFNFSCVIRWHSLNWRSAVKSASVEVEGWRVFSQFSVGSSSESKIYYCGGTGTGKSSTLGTGRNIRIIDSPLFSL
jgi:hypothetical protein